MRFRHLGILSVTEENAYCEFLGLVPFLQLAIHMGTDSVNCMLKKANVS
jgi:hypothetical protein